MRDRTRQVVVTAAAVFMVVGTLFGTGVLGTRVEESAGGSLSATATLIAPAVPAFSIWSVIYAGLIGYVVWQWLPRNVESPRLQRIAWLAAASMVLNAAWLLVTQAGWLWVSVVVIIALVATLGELVRRLGSSQSRPVAERLLVDGTFGLYLGWTSVATAANITATLVASGVDPAAPTSELLAVVVLAVAAGVGIMLSVVLRARIAIALAMGWGLAWIGYGRLAVDPVSTLVGVTAAAAAAVVLSVTALQRLRAAREPVPVTVHRVGAHG